MMFKCLNSSNKENVITIQGARADDAFNPFASIMFQNYDQDTKLTYNMVSISCVDHYGDTSNNGSGDLIFRTSYTGGCNLQEHMRLLFNGNVVIGSNVTNDLKLNVGGGVQALGYCNLLADSSNDTSTHKAPTCRVLNVVADAVAYTSNMLKTVADIASFASNLLPSNTSISSTWASNAASFGSNVSSWLSNDNSPYLSNNATYGSNTSYWLSNVWQPIISNVSWFASNNILPLSNCSTYASNTSTWLSNNVVEPVLFSYNNSSWLSNISVPFVSNVAVYSCNTVNWVSNISLPWACNQIASNTSNIYWNSNVSVYGSNLSTWLSNNLIQPVLFAYNNSSWLSNSAIVWTSNTAIAASNMAFATWSNTSCNVFIGINSNVGIGISNPSYQLEVQNTIKSATLLTNELQVIGNTSKAIDNVIALKSLNPTILDASLSSTTAVFGGGPSPTYNSNNEAWNFVNDSNGKKISWYFFANSNTSNTQYRYKNLKTAYYKIRFNGSNVPGSDAWPSFSMYSLPLFDGKDAAVWYRARMNFFTFTESNLQPNKDYCFYINDDPTSVGFLNVVCEKKIKVHFSSNQFQAFSGPSNETRIQDTNVLEYLTLQTNSTAALNAINFTMTEMGYRFGTEITRYITCYTSN